MQIEIEIDDRLAEKVIAIGLNLQEIVQDIMDSEGEKILNKQIEEVISGVECVALVEVGNYCHALTKMEIRPQVSLVCLKHYSIFNVLQ